MAALLPRACEGIAMHECPECGQACCCCGDIDDCEMNTVDTYVNCVHCLEGGSDYEDDNERTKWVFLESHCRLLDGRTHVV